MLHRIHEHKWIVRLTTSMAQQCRHTPSPPDPTGPLPPDYLHVIVRCISPASLQQSTRLGTSNPEEVAEVVAKGTDGRGVMPEFVIRFLGWRHGRKNMPVLLAACRELAATLSGVSTPLFDCRCNEPRRTWMVVTLVSSCPGHLPSSYCWSKAGATTRQGKRRRYACSR